jgi:hypothetical protein
MSANRLPPARDPDRDPTADDFNTATLAELRHCPARLALLDHRGCELCGARPVAIRGAWTPGESLQRRLLTPEGKTRTMIYALCKRCSRGPRAAVQQRIEDRILAGFDRLGAASQ